MSNHVVIMAGGVGSRLWPISTPERPKQFMDVLGTGRTLIQMAAARFQGLCPVGNIWVVTNARYVELVRSQLPDIPPENILSEPAARNTAPCIAYASWKIQHRDPQANIIVSPSDHLVIDIQEYQRVIRKALDFVSIDRCLMTIGIRPSRPETGYGYISSVPTSVQGVNKVEAFKEKPDLATAQSYLETGSYLWNSGIFVWNVRTIVDSLRQFTPSIAALMDRMSMSFDTPEQEAAVSELFPQCERISIDYAVMEKAGNIYTIPADFGWSDLGSWDSVRLALTQELI